MKVTPLKALSNYFNAGDGYSLGEGTVMLVNGDKWEIPHVPVKRPVREFAAELKALSDEEKEALVQGVLAATGDTL